MSKFDQTFFFFFCQNPNFFSKNPNIPPFFSSLFAEMFGYASSNPVPEFGNDFNKTVNDISGVLVDNIYKRLTNQPIRQVKKKSKKSKSKKSKKSRKNK